MDAAAILVAAGSGERLGADRPKAFVVVGGRPLLAWSVDAIRAAGIERIAVALPEGHDAPAGCEGVRGGATRSESVRAALALVEGHAGRVVVHDAARPFADPALFGRCLAALEDADAAIAAARVTDTVKRAGADGVVTETLDRSQLWAVQTPQAFRTAALAAALAQPDEVLRAATDDAALVERAGGRVVVVESGPANFKVTTPHDRELAELLLARRLP
ncbi:MAG TPA: 2-C-methyl-D-erythritol 4-phosphate cytidylyltransferase [Solirubrobacteraceae bacterium]|jgi:2-C-methyl-D-erythritol 4-phosphate cytidylyltransferase